MAGSDFAGRGDVHEALRPAARGGLRPLRVVVGHDHVDGENAFEALALALDKLDRLNSLVVGRNQGGTVEISPAVILHMRDLEPLRTKLHGKLDVTADIVNFLSLDGRVDGERHPELGDPTGDIELL